MVCQPDEIVTDLVCIPSDPAKFVSQFYRLGLGLIGGVAVLFIIYAGYLYMTSEGRPEQLQKAKSYMYYSIAGVLLAIFGYVFMTVVAHDILHIPGFQ